MASLDPAPAPRVPSVLLTAVLCCFSLNVPLAPGRLEARLRQDGGWGKLTGRRPREEGGWSLLRAPECTSLAGRERVQDIGQELGL